MIETIGALGFSGYLIVSVLTGFAIRYFSDNNESYQEIAGLLWPIVIPAMLCIGAGRLATKLKKLKEKKNEKSKKAN